jgi:hypothetical protein
MNLRWAEGARVLERRGMTRIFGRENVAYRITLADEHGLDGMGITITNLGTMKLMLRAIPPSIGKVSFGELAMNAINKNGEDRRQRIYLTTFSAGGNPG